MAAALCRALPRSLPPLVGCRPPTARWLHTGYRSLPFDSFRNCRLFQPIDLHWPELQLVHEKPFIFLVPGFFSPAECAALRAKAALSSSMRQQGFDNTDARVTGARTSSGCTLRNDEVSGLRRRIARLTNLSEDHMQPLKVSRYRAGQRFDMHTDAWRGDLRGRRPARGDWWADRQRARRGVPGAAIPGVNRIVTVFVYLNSVLRGGRTRWRWLDYDARAGGGAGRAFYEAPRPGTGRTDMERGSGPELSVSPEEGLAVVHFPSTLPAFGGVTDYNVWHEGEAAQDEKWVAQQFIWSHPGLDWRRVLDRENWEPEERRCAVGL